MMRCGICHTALRLNGTHYTRNGLCSGETLPLRISRRTAAYEARVICKYFYPWRLKTPVVTS
jgi:hypothetical protein